MLQFYAQTDTGNKRTLNEDRLWPPQAPHPYRHSEHGLLFVIADGMGGAGAGDIASQTAIETIPRVYYASDNPHTEVSLRLEAALHAAHHAICDKATESPDWQKMGTTVVAVVIKVGEPHLWAAWAGDSRAYHWSAAEGLVQITTDHSRIQQIIDTEHIPWEELHFHPQRSTLTNSLTAQRTSITVSQAELALSPGDQILLCSDGLTSEVHDDAIARVLAENSPDQAATALIQRAKAPKQWMKDAKPVRVQGGGDNISVLIVSFAYRAAMPRRWLVGAGLAMLGVLLLVIGTSIYYPRSTAPATPTPASLGLITNTAVSPEITPTVADAATVTRVSVTAPPRAVQPTVTLVPTSALLDTQAISPHRTRRIQLLNPPDNYELQVTDETILTIAWEWDAMDATIDGDIEFVFLVSQDSQLTTAEQSHQVRLAQSSEQRYSFTAQVQDLGFVAADTAQVYYWWIGVAQGDPAEVTVVSHEPHTLTVLPD